MKNNDDEIVWLADDGLGRNEKDYEKPFLDDGLMKGEIKEVENMRWCYGGYEPTAHLFWVAQALAAGVDGSIGRNVIRATKPLKVTFVNTHIFFGGVRLFTDSLSDFLKDNEEAFSRMGNNLEIIDMTSGLITTDRLIKSCDGRDVVIFSSKECLKHMLHDSDDLLYSLAMRIQNGRKTAVILGVEKDPEAISEDEEEETENNAY